MLLILLFDFLPFRREPILVESGQLLDHFSFESHVNRPVLDPGLLHLLNLFPDTLPSIVLNKSILLFLDSFDQILDITFRLFLFDFELFPL